MKRFDFTNALSFLVLQVNTVGNSFIKIEIPFLFRNVFNAVSSNIIADAAELSCNLSNPELADDELDIMCDKFIKDISHSKLELVSFNKDIDTSSNTYEMFKQFEYVLTDFLIDVNKTT